VDFSDVKGYITTVKFTVDEPAGVTVSPTMGTPETTVGTPGTTVGTPGTTAVSTLPTTQAASPFPVAGCIAGLLLLALVSRAREKRR